MSTNSDGYLTAQEREAIDLELDAQYPAFAKARIVGKKSIDNLRATEFIREYIEGSGNPEAWLAARDLVGDEMADAMVRDMGGAPDK